MGNDSSSTAEPCPASPRSADPERCDRGFTRNQRHLQLLHQKYGHSPFDDVPLKLDYWQEKYDMAQKFDLPFLVVVRGFDVLGFALVSPWRQRAGYLKVVENSIYLSAPATGKGLGTKLFTALLERCRAVGIKEVIAVIADRGAHASIALHEKFGFVQQGHLANVANRFGKPIGSYLLSLKLPKVLNLLGFCQQRS